LPYAQAVSGPILIFDKSALQGLSVDESCWLGQFYSSNITPLFYVETLADLEKEVRRGRTSEQIVGDIARKTFVLAATANAHHGPMIIADLMGHAIDMSRFGPGLGSGKSVVTGDKAGIIFKQAPEIDALNRWQLGKFLEVEREYARVWRRLLGTLDLEASYRTFRPLIENLSRPRDLREAKDMADSLLRDPRLRDVQLPFAFALLNVPVELQPSVYGRWWQAGSPFLGDFAPYAAHVLTVELFFHLALSADLISKDRASNKADIAYLYYLPFCMVFSSSDSLHAKTVPLFVRDRQQFVRGSDLKDDLRRLDEHYMQFPSDVRSEGIQSFAKHPPEEGDFLTCRLWDLFLPSWREKARNIEETPPEAQKALLSMFKKMIHGEPASEYVGIDEAAFVIIEHKVPPQMGKWRILPPGVENQKPNDEGE
jgi:hypothetical protein